jgi:hypothetical protein
VEPLRDDEGLSAPESIGRKADEPKADEPKSDVAPLVVAARLRLDGVRR